MPDTVTVLLVPTAAVSNNALVLVNVTVSPDTMASFNAAVTTALVLPSNTLLLAAYCAVSDLGVIKFVAVLLPTTL